MHPIKKVFIPRYSIEKELTDFLKNYQHVPYSHRQSINRVMNTFIIVNIGLICKRFFHVREVFLLPSVLSGTEHIWAFMCKNSLLICFESYQDIPYSHTGRVGMMMVEDGEHFANG